MIAYAEAWNAAGGDTVKYESLAREVTAKLHAEFPAVVAADMRTPSRAEILSRLLKR